MKSELPILVVGGGIAGLSVALAAAPAPVRLLTRAINPRSTASLLAQGGIAVAVGPGDTPQAHADDTCIAGAFHNDRAMVELLTSQAREAVDWLHALGVPFDTDEAGRWRLGREGGHRCARIVHAGGDATGARVMDALVATARRATHIQRLTGVEVDGLVVRDGVVCGVCLIHPDGRREAMHGRAVVLATGGIGGLFAQTSNPPDADGSGLALAQAAGAALRDLEFVQFHPTALALPGQHSLPLFTEALRGAGARLCDAHGRPLMAGVHPLADLAPRDIVARRVWQAQREGGAWLDARHLGQDISVHFPTVFAACLAHGIDPRIRPIPVVPAAHFHMGGVQVDADGRTSRPGLYAVGEVACNGVHGANRLASNSLLEGVVFGRRLGALLRQLPVPDGGGGRHRIVRRPPALAPAGLMQLRMLMSHAMGPVRSEASLTAALETCAALAARGWQARLAQAMLAAALQRRSSLGAHYRCDTVPAPA